MIRHLLLGANVLASIVASSHLASAQVTTTLAAEVRAGTYIVEPTHTRVVFSVSHMGFTTWYGDLTSVSGKLTFDSAAPSKSALFVSVLTNSFFTTNAKLDDELKSPMWFDAMKFPTVTFKSTRITLVGPNEGKITGELTLHGIKRPITLIAHFNGAGVNPLDKKYTLGFDATGQISRAEFGVKMYEPMIGDSVKLQLSGAFEAQD